MEGFNEGSLGFIFCCLTFELKTKYFFIVCVLNTLKPVFITDVKYYLCECIETYFSQENNAQVVFGYIMKNIIIIIYFRKVFFLRKK